MLPESVGQRYAAALFALAREADRMEAIEQEMLEALKILEQHPQLARALRAPNVPSVIKKNMCKRLFERALSDTTVHLMYVLVDKQREQYLQAIADQYHKMVLVATQSTTAEVETAVEFPAAFKKHVAAALTEKEGLKVLVQWKVNPELIGGFVVRIGDRLTDFSLRTRLAELQERLQGGPIGQRAI